MPATVIVGAQWGDEGKGKVVDLLAGHSDLVCRYQGGPNAGHTIIRDGERFALHHIPSGIISGATSVIGSGCVVNPGQLVQELDGLESRGIATDTLHLSGNAHLIMPWHLLLDAASEKALGKLQIGTTRPRNRTGVRRQSSAHRHPRPGPPRPEDSREEGRAGAEREERDPREDLRASEPIQSPADVLAELITARRATCAGHIDRRVVAGRRRPACGQARPARGSAGNAARPRSWNLPLRHLLQPARRLGRERA